MNFLTRVWLAITTVLGIVLVILALLVKLQHDAVYSQLLRQRLTVIAAATAAPFKSVAEMGLPVATVRNAQDLLNRAWQTDPAISNIVLFDGNGATILSATGGTVPFTGRDITRAQEDSANGQWGFETATALVSGTTIINENGDAAGGLAVIYPLNELQARSNFISARIRNSALALLGVFAILAFVLLRYRLRPTIRSLDAMAGQAEDNAEDARAREVLPNDFDDFSATLAEATAKFRAARSTLAAIIGDDSQIQPLTESKSVDVIAIPDSPMATIVSRRLTLLIAALVLGITLSLAYVAYRSVEESFAPELNKRTRLIVSIANDGIARTLKAGVSIDTMVGGRDYFTTLLRDFPEISYFALITNRPILEMGERPALSTAALLRTGSAGPIVVDGQLVANVVAIKNASYLSRQWRDVILDLLVVVLVTILLAIELVSVMTSHSLTGPLTRLEYILKLLAAGDFSRRIVVTGIGAVERLGQELSRRAELLAAMMGTARGNPECSRTPDVASAFTLPASLPRIIKFCNLSDVRLPLFLFAAADEFPLSFFSIYVRDADNPLSWLNPGIVISLPLAAYLLAVVVASPYARPLSKYFGHRNLFLLAAIPTVISNLGLYIATSVPEIVFFRSLTGLGYAFASLACQDYVIDEAPKEQRAQALGLFHVAMFGGIYAGTALGGVIADRLGQRTVFLVCAVLVLVSAALIFRMLPGSSRASATADPSERSSLRQLTQTMGNMKFSVLLFGIVLPQAILDQVFISYLLSLQMNALGASIADTGRMLMIYFLMIILSGSVYGRLPAGRLPPVAITLAGALLGGITLLVAATITNGMTMLFAAVGTGLGYGLVRGPQMAIVMESAEGNLAHLGSAAVLGAVRVVERVGSVVGLIAIAGIAGTFGLDVAMGVIAVLVLSGSVAFFIYYTAINNALTFTGRNT